MSNMVSGKTFKLDNVCNCLTVVGDLDPCTIVIFGASGKL